MEPTTMLGLTTCCSEREASVLGVSDIVRQGEERRTQDCEMSEACESRGHGKAHLILQEVGPTSAEKSCKRGGSDRVH